MQRRRQYALMLVVLLCWCVPHSTAQKRDPLNEKEVDEMRAASLRTLLRTFLMSGLQSGPEYFFGSLL